MLVADTDNDGYLDGHEINLGRNPLDPNSHPGETAAIVINEILYDYPGSDIGHEFVELYNNGETAVEIGGYKLQGSEAGRFQTIRVIPEGKIIGPQGYFLIGGDQVTDAYGNLPDLVVHLGLQNGDQNDPGAPGSAVSDTDGVRLIEPNGYVLDTVLYDTPNTTLFGDDSVPGDEYELNPDVDPGQSLSRDQAGVDTNRATDFVVLNDPSPTGSGSPDSDGDGLSNVEETYHNTDPLDADTDGDGYVDGSEVGANTNPLGDSDRPGVVINELYYDPAGSDSTLKEEFVELYNPESYPVDIGHLRIEYGGTSFGYGHVDLPLGAVIPAGSFFLIGDENVESTFGVAPDLVSPLAFQNGDSDPADPYYKLSPTDAVRLVGYRWVPLDTVLYDVPNENGLPGDVNGPDNPAAAEELNPDVQPGHSLSRKLPGLDTNHNSDWQDQTSPNPKQ